MGGQLVAVRLPPGEAFLAALDRAWEAGDAVLPLRPDAPDALVADTLDRLRPGRLVHADGSGRSLADERPDGVPVDPEVALIVATSGSTGAPKGVELTHAALAASTRASIARLGAQPGESWLACLPFDHVAGLACVLRSRALDARPEIHPRFDVAALARTPASHCSLVPTQLHRLLDAGVDLARFRTVLLGGGAPPPPLLARAAAAGARVVVSYGMTETCGGCVYDGMPLDGVDVDVDRAHRIRVRGPVLLQGYRGEPERTVRAFQDGWLTTADRGRIDADGRLTVLGRADDVVITGGENVDVGAVARALLDAAGVADVAVTGRPDPEWGEVVVAVVVAERDTTPTLAGLRAHARGLLPDHALPRELVLVDAVPRDDLGKVSRQALTQLLGSATPAATGRRRSAGR